MIRVRYVSVTASCTVLLRLTEPSGTLPASLARAWHTGGSQEGGFLANAVNSQRDHQRDRRSNESQSIVLRFNGRHLHRNLLDTTPFLCFCLGLVLKIFTRYCILWEVVASGFVG